MPSNLSARLRSKLVPWRVRVTTRTALTDRLLRVAATQPDGMTFIGGDTIAIRVTDGGIGPSGTWRRYTVSAADHDSFEFIAYRTLAGPASDWLDRLEPGTMLVGRGPEDPVRLAATGLEVIVVFGDDTAIGTLQSITSNATSRVVALLSLTSPYESIAAHLRGPTFDGLRAGASCDTATDDGLAELVLEHGPRRVGVVAVGLRSSVAIVRRQARVLAIPPDHVALRPFWAPGRSGLE
jgi:NADPH-dependent ferric siderophore reductase